MRRQLFLSLFILFLFLIFLIQAILGTRYLNIGPQNALNHLSYNPIRSYFRFCFIGGWILDWAHLLNTWIVYLHHIGPKSLSWGPNFQVGLGHYSLQWANNIVVGGKTCAAANLCGYELNWVDMAIISCLFVYPLASVFDQMKHNIMDPPPPS